MHRLPHPFWFALLLATVLPACKPADNDAPIITVRQGLPAFVILGDTLPVPMIEVLDNRDCRLEDQLVTEGFVDTDRYGNYHVDYFVSDEAGNSSEVGFDVQVGMVKESYYAVEYRATDTCTSGVYEYLAGIQDCTCPENKVLLFNLGNFGPGNYVNLEIGGEFGQVLNVVQSQGPLTWTGDGLAVPTGDTLNLVWQVDNGAVIEQCSTQLVRN